MCNPNRERNIISRFWDYGMLLVDVIVNTFMHPQIPAAPESVDFFDDYDGDDDKEHPNYAEWLYGLQHSEHSLSFRPWLNAASICSTEDTDNENDEEDDYMDVDRYIILDSDYFEANFNNKRPKKLNKFNYI